MMIVLSTRAITNCIVYMKSSELRTTEAMRATPPAQFKKNVSKVFWPVDFAKKFCRI